MAFEKMLNFFKPGTIVAEDKREDIVAPEKTSAL